ncbi:MAG: hypothetical protein ACYC2E_13840 [Sulfuricella sp.]
MLQNRILKQVAQHVRRESLPVNFELWNGEVLKFSDFPRVTVSVRSSKGLSSLIRPTLGKFARNYVEQHIDLVGGAREIMRLGESLCEASGRIAKKMFFH